MIIIIIIITKGLLKGLDDLEIHCWERPECWEESWRLEETCWERPLANTDVEKL